MIFVKSGHIISACYNPLKACCHLGFWLRQYVDNMRVKQIFKYVFYCSLTHQLAVIKSQYWLNSRLTRMWKCFIWEIVMQNKLLCIIFDHQIPRKLPYIQRITANIDQCIWPFTPWYLWQHRKMQSGPCWGKLNQLSLGQSELSAGSISFFICLS